VKGALYYVSGLGRASGHLEEVASMLEGRFKSPLPQEICLVAIVVAACPTTNSTTDLRCRIRLASYRVNGRDSYGVVEGERIADLADGRYGDLRSWLAGNEMAGAAKVAPSIAVSEVLWRPVIPNPDKILCVGLNFLEHIREVGKKVEDYPLVFLRLASTQVGHLQPIIRPRASENLDFEGELAVIIGKKGRHISKEDALQHVAGYSIYNDASVRDWQRHTTQYTPGKNFPSTGAFGPWMVTADEIPDPTKLHLTTRLNGAVVQDSGLDDLRFSIPEIIRYISIFTELVPGDVIITGTPRGVGAARKPPLWMKPGDTVEVEIGSMGKLRNPIEQES
jgi:2-keto-4-pentenoate hydratase/2-oxohepta-3-ene-1,7-dioic acid hydratase in catechol pathway